MTMIKDAWGNYVPAPILPGKGKQGENCNRTACQAEGAVFYNKGTRAYYCKTCAQMIQASCFKFGDEPLFNEIDLGVTKENYWRYRP